MSGETSGAREHDLPPRTVDTEFSPAALAPPSGCPIGWQPSALAPVFFGYQHCTPNDHGAPANLRVFYPSLDGAPQNAPILSGCGRYPVILFAHGFCDGDTNHYLRWVHLPSQLARSGYVVVVPHLADIARHPTESPATQQTLTSTLNWIRQSWEHRLTLRPEPATGLAGHSHGALHAGILAAARTSVTAVASISGIWNDWRAGGGTKPIFRGALPRLFTWGSGGDVDAQLSNADWNAIAKPKHRAIFNDAEHFDYLHSASLPCFNFFSRGACPRVGAATADLVTMFFANYLPPELWPDLPSRVPNNLVPPPLSLTPEQQFYAGGHLVGLPTFNADSRCQVSITFELPLDRTVPQVLEMLRTQAAQTVQNAGLVPKFSGSTSLSAWVASQSPAAGTMVIADSEVRMTMQTGPIP